MSSRVKTVELVVLTVAGGGKVQSLKVAAVGLQSVKMKRSVEQSSPLVLKSLEKCLNFT